MDWNNFITQWLPGRSRPDDLPELDFFGLPDQSDVFSLLNLVNQDDSQKVLMGRQAAVTYSKMRRDAQVAGLLQLIRGPILSASWSVESQRPRVAAFVNEQLGLGPEPSLSPFPFRKILQEALTSLEYGFALHEKVFGIRQGRMVIEQLGFRYQTSIEEFRTVDGILSSVVQIKRFTPTIEKTTIPREHLVYYAPMVLGSSWQGQSLLEASYSNWYFKTKLDFIDGIAAARYGIPIPIGYYEDGTSEDSRKKFAAELAGLSANQRGYLALPEGRYRVEYLALPERARLDLNQAREHHDTQIATGMAGQLLSTSRTASQTRSFGNTMGSLFFSALSVYSDMIRDALQQDVITPLVEANFQAGPPALLEYQNLDNANFKQLVDALGPLAKEGLVRPGPETERDLRGRMGLPETDSVYPPPERPEPFGGAE